MSCAARSHDWELRGLGGVLVITLPRQNILPGASWLACLTCFTAQYINVMYSNVNTSVDNCSELLIYFLHIAPLIFIKHLIFSCLFKVPLPKSPACSDWLALTGVSRFNPHTMFPHKLCLRFCYYGHSEGADRM